MLAIASLLLPLLFVGTTWWLSRQQAYEALPNWRKALFTAGLCCLSISAFVLAAFAVHTYVISRGTTPYDLDLAYPVGSMMVLALIATCAAFFGRRASRFLLLLTGVGTFALWYIAALGASP